MLIFEVVGLVIAFGLSCFAVGSALQYKIDNKL